MEAPALLLSFACLLFVVVVPAVVFHKPALAWLRLKRYQYEVTFGLYMLTPTEKFILSSYDLDQYSAVAC